MKAVTGTLPSPDGWRTIAAWAALHPDRHTNVFEDVALPPHDFRAARTALFLGPAAFELFRRKCEQAAGGAGPGGALQRVELGPFGGGRRP